MLIERIFLRNYRNYSTKQLLFEPGLNIIIGKNGVGKTNILESIIVVSNTKSFRTNNDQELIKKDTDFARVDIYTDKSIYKVVINKKNKSLFIDNSIINKTSDFIGKLNAVIFKPDDLELFKQTPSERRKILNIEISKISKIYIKSLSRYMSLLKDKNRLLKEIEIDEVLLNIIDESMIPLIETIIEEREKFFKIINSYLSDIYNRISNKNQKIEIVYKKCCDIKDIKDELYKARQKDLYYHYSTFGIHHDDYYFLCDGYNANEIASQGQKRMMLISFKFALVNYIKEMINITPIILFDDILSELDKDNEERLLNMIPEDTQVIITDTDIEDIKINRKFNLIEIKEEENV